MKDKHASALVIFIVVAVFSLGAADYFGNGLCTSDPQPTTTTSSSQQ